MEKKLPKGWVETTLGVVAKWGSGGTPSRGNSSYYGGNIPWIKTGDLNKGIITNASEFITEAGLKNSSAKLFPKGSIAIAMYGATIGKTAEFGIAAATNQACGVAQVYDGVERNFLHQYLKSEKQTFIDKGKGGAQPNISQTVLKAHPFPLPPLPEQKRIVTKLDGLFEHLEKLNSRLDRIPVLLKNFRQAVLTQAVTGKLTEEWRIGKELEMHVLDDFCESSFYGPRFGKHEYTETGIPTVRTTDMTEDGYLNITDETPRVSLKNPDKIELYKVKKGDLLITRTGSIGKMARHKSNEIIIPSAYLIRFRFTSQVLTDFVYYCLTSPFGQREMGLNSTALTQPNLNARKIKELKIPLFSLKEQQEVINRIENLFKKADHIESKYKTLKAKIDQLPQAILAKAFKGELVEQLPTDGDARDLLEEIQQLKAAGLSKGKGKRKKKKETRKKKGQGKLF